MPPGLKRRILYDKHLAPETFVLFFQRGPNETSWSIRDYSTAGSVSLRYAADFRDPSGRIPLASEILESALHDFPAPAHRTSDLSYWHEIVVAKNAEHLAASTEAKPVEATDRSEPNFPVLNLSKLMALPKSQKRGDIDRILDSKNSEDYVTWNFFQLLDSAPRSPRWPALLRLAGMSAIGLDEAPQVGLWRTVSSPPAYEAASRVRLQSSENSLWRQRSQGRDPVEGASEIDIVLEGRTYLAFVEAKLGSDISLRTTYDPERNQIARNIDCLLETCGARRPLFWMFVRDRRADRAYTQLMERYRDVSELRRCLPHRSAAELATVSSSLAVVVWSELMTLLPEVGGQGIDAAALEELRRRV